MSTQMRISTRLKGEEGEEGEQNLPEKKCQPQFRVSNNFTKKKLYLFAWIINLNKNRNISIVVWVMLSFLIK